MLKEFKAFVTRGNAVDLAIAVIIGAAFGRVITSLVRDVIMPPIGMLLVGIDFERDEVPPVHLRPQGRGVARVSGSRGAGPRRTRRTEPGRKDQP